MFRVHRSYLTTPGHLQNTVDTLADINHGPAGTERTLLRTRPKGQHQRPYKQPPQKAVDEFKEMIGVTTWLSQDHFEGWLHSPQDKAGHAYAIKTVKSRGAFNRRPTRFYGPAVPPLDGAFQVFSPFLVATPALDAFHDALEYFRGGLEQTPGYIGYKVYTGEADPDFQDAPIELDPNVVDGEKHIEVLEVSIWPSEDLYLNWRILQDPIDFTKLGLVSSRFYYEQESFREGKKVPFFSLMGLALNFGNFFSKD